MRNPCNQCEKRQIGCHTHCPEYRRWKKMKDYAAGERIRINNSTPEPSKVSKQFIYKAMKGRR